MGRSRRQTRGYPYTDENLVSQAVCLYASAGLRNGEGVILIMAAAHCDSINGRIAAEGFDVEALKATLGQVRVFGEIVSLLRGTNLPATTRLEELWSQAIDNHSVSVMCTYALCGSAHETLPESLTALHSHSLA